MGSFAYRSVSSGGEYELAIYVCLVLTYPYLLQAFVLFSIQTARFKTPTRRKNDPVESILFQVSRFFLTKDHYFVVDTSHQVNASQHRFFFIDYIETTAKALRYPEWSRKAESFGCCCREDDTRSAFSVQSLKTADVLKPLVSSSLLSRLITTLRMTYPKGFWIPRRGFSRVSRKELSRYPPHTHDAPYI